MYQGRYLKIKTHSVHSSVKLVVRFQQPSKMKLGSRPRQNLHMLLSLQRYSSPLKNKFIKISSYLKLKYFLISTTAKPQCNDHISVHSLMGGRLNKRLKRRRRKRMKKR